MNPLTLVKRIQNINSREAELGISEEASWHAKYKDSAYVFVGGIPFDLTEGDLLAVFAQYGEIVDVNLIRDKGTGKSKGFAFIAYEDQRSTNLAVDNLNGAQVAGRIIRVDHVADYKKKEEEDEETQRQKREARGVCRAFQRGECTRGASCKFSHDEQRAANTGWGPGDQGPRRGHDKFEGPKKGEKISGNERPLDSHLKHTGRTENKRSRRHNGDEVEQKSKEEYHRRDEKRSRRHEGDEYALRLGKDDYRRDEKGSRRHGGDEHALRLGRDDYRRDEKRLRRHEESEFDHKSRGDYYRSDEKRLKRHEDNQFEPKSREDDYKRDDRRSRRHDGGGLEPRSRDDGDRREEKRIKKHESEYYPREDRDKKGGEDIPAYARNSSSNGYRERDDRRHK